MRRRDLIAGLLLVPLARQTLAAVEEISIVDSGFPNRTPIHFLIEALGALGYENGKTADVEVLGGEGDSKRLEALVAGLASKKPDGIIAITSPAALAPKLAAGLASKNPDVIIAITSPAALALKRAAVVTPVVFAFVTDPVGLGLVASFAHPGGNFTGVTYSEATLGGKRLELLLQALPGTQRVAVIWSRSFAENAIIFDAIRQAAQAHAVEVFSKELEGAQDLAPAFDYVRDLGAQALIFITDNLMLGPRKEIAALALSHHLPSIHSFPPEVEDGGLMSYADQVEIYRRTAALA